MVKVTCQFCNEEHRVGILPQHYRLWKAGELLQNAAPYLSTNDSELLISGICEPCFDKAFGE